MYFNSILTYVFAAVKYKLEQRDELDACLNSVCNVFSSFREWESVQSFVCGLDRLDFHYLVKLHRVKFHQRGVNSATAL
jgi:hypothetical protein